MLLDKEPELILYYQSNQTTPEGKSLKRFGILKQTLMFICLALANSQVKQ